MKPTVETLLSEIISSYGSTWVKRDLLLKGANKRRVSLNPLVNLLNTKALRQIQLDGNVYYTFSKFDMWETYVAYNAIRILKNYHCSSSISDELIEKYIKEAENQTKIKLHEQQKEAVYCAIRNGCCVITGGPGTGKSCVLKTIEYVLKRCFPGIDIRFTAPTGKAARRITESTGSPAKTTQKEIGITVTNKNKKMFGGDVLIIDEISMLDLETAFYVFNAMQNGQKIILVGDIDQLPSVGHGAILRDFIWSEVIPTVMLTKTFRQANDSTLFANIQNIRNDVTEFKDGDDFKVIHTDSEKALEIVIDEFLKLYNEYGVKNIACLLPYRKAGLLCSDNVNNILQQMVNPVGNKPFLTTRTENGREIKFSIGDPVMQLENRDECANGDVGFVTGFNDGKMQVKFIDGVVEYNKYSVSKLSLAYAMSINKSQGSEYKWIVMGITMAHKAMLSKNLLYTGITRAKEGVVLIQEDEAIHTAISNAVAFDRITFLAEKLQFYYKKEIFMK